MIYRIGGSVLFAIAMVFYVRYCWRKSERDWEDMKQFYREHAYGMIDHGRLLEKQDQRRRDRRPLWAIDAGCD